MFRKTLKTIVMVLLLITPAALYSQSVDKLGEEDFRRKPAPEPEPVPPIRKSHSPGEIWREPFTGMEFVWVPGGCFQMGQSEEEKRELIGGFGEERHGKFFSDELPRHEVCVDGFWMGTKEVTVAAFQRFVAAAGYQTDAEREGFAWVFNGKEWEKRSGANWRDAGFQQPVDHPVVNVSWNDAGAMAEWLSRQGGYKFRLSSEAEWEYACRAGTKTARFWGDSPVEACRYANVGDRTAKKTYSGLVIHECDDGQIHTSPVGSYQANGFGMLDMLGNVWEWCEDVYAKDAYAQRQEKNPLVTSGGSDRVLRGGSWYSDPANVRCALRLKRSPANRYYDLGFRLARTD